MFGGAIRIYMQCSTDPPRSHGQNMRASLISPSARVRVAYDYRSFGPFIYPIVTHLGGMHAVAAPRSRGRRRSKAVKRMHITRRPYLLMGAGPAARLLSETSFR